MYYDSLVLKIKKPLNNNIDKTDKSILLNLKVNLM